MCTTQTAHRFDQRVLERSWSVVIELTPPMRIRVTGNPIDFRAKIKLER